METAPVLAPGIGKMKLTAIAISEEKRGKSKNSMEHANKLVTEAFPESKDVHIHQSKGGYPEFIFLKLVEGEEDQRIQSLMNALKELGHKHTTLKEE